MLSTTNFQVRPRLFNRIFIVFAILTGTFLLLLLSSKFAVVPVEVLEDKRPSANVVSSGSAHANSSRTQAGGKNSSLTRPSLEISSYLSKRTKKINKQKSGSTNFTIACLIFTTFYNWQSRGRAVLLTWAQRCDFPIFVYSEEDGLIPAEESGPGVYTLPLDIKEGRDHLTKKSLYALEWTWKKIKNANWVIKCDDDTYIVMDNLRRFLASYDYTEQYYIGRKLTSHLPNGYNSGGGGYVLSRGALNSLFKSGLPDKCPLDGVDEDLDIGKCLAEVGIFPENTTDGLQRLRFHSDNPLLILEANRPDLVQNYYFKKHNYFIGDVKKDRILSPESITFHYMSPAHMFFVDFLLEEIQHTRHRN